MHATNHASFRSSKLRNKTCVSHRRSLSRSMQAKECRCERCVIGRLTFCQSHPQCGIGTRVQTQPLLQNLLATSTLSKTSRYVRRCAFTPGQRHGRKSKMSSITLVTVTGLTLSLLALPFMQSRPRSVGISLDSFAYDGMRYLTEITNMFFKGFT